MPLLQFWPAQSEALLVAGGRELKAGDVFEASGADAVELLATPHYEVREAPPGSEVAVEPGTSGLRQYAGTDGDDDTDAEPTEAEREDNLNGDDE